MTIESSTVDFDQNNKLITDLKKQIELEIDKINNLYEKINNQVVVFFKKKHEKLIEEEIKIKEKLKTEVTKIKKKLENHLSDCNNIIKGNEKIKNGITKLKNNKENNIRKVVSYISTIKKKKKKTNLLLNESLKSLEISFNESESNINYKEYNFYSYNFFNSKILGENDKNLLISWLPNKPSKIKLLFDTTRDGDYSSTFHDKCDGKCPTLVVIKSNTGYIFGGYVTSAWTANNSNIGA